MDIYEAIYSRRTVRDFQEKEIEPGIIRKIIDAGLKAPSNNHLRQWEFIIINDRDARLRLLGKAEQDMSEEEAAEYMKNRSYTDEYQHEMYFIANQKQTRMLLTSGCLIIPCFHQRSPLLKPSCLSSLNALAAMWCCIENILVAAAGEGIQGVTRIPCNEGEPEYIKRTLNIPEGYEVPCYLALGYPDENAVKIRQHSVRAEDRLHFNQW